MAHEILLVADPFRLNGTMVYEAHRFLEKINRLEKPLSVHLVVNRTQDVHDAKRVYGLLRKEALDSPWVHFKYFGYLPQDPFITFFRSMALRLKYGYELWRH